MDHQFNLDDACAAATERLRQSVNRSAGQHRMHLTRRAAAMVFQRGAALPHFSLVPVDVVDFYPKEPA